jgi:hypothetical protein
MHLTVKCAETKCPEFGHLNVIDVGQLGNHNARKGSNVACRACGALMRIVPINHQRGKARARVVN